MAEDIDIEEKDIELDDQTEFTPIPKAQFMQKKLIPFGQFQNL